MISKLSALILRAHPTTFKFRFCNVPTWNESEFMKLTQEYLNNVSDHFENGEFGNKIEVELSEGVLKIITPKQGTFIINRQTPNRQIWYSSPISGPARYNYDNNEWVNYNGRRLKESLEEELKILLT